MPELNLAYMERTWNDYKHDDALNTIGKLNLVAWMGERMGLALKEVYRLRARVAKLEKVLRTRVDELEKVCHATE